VLAPDTRVLVLGRFPGAASLALPSTSPAYTVSVAEKLAAWRAIGDHLVHDTGCRVNPAGST